jgi:hypothetical protein
MVTENTTTRAKIGLSQVPREVDLDVDDAEAFMREFEDAVAGGVRVWWVTDREGHRHGIVVDKIAYIDVEPSRDNRRVGFSV